MLKPIRHGELSAPIILVQMVGNHELSLIDSEVISIRKYAGSDFCLLAFKVDNWNVDFSPWNAPPVFGNEFFGDGAKETFLSVLGELEAIGREKCYYIGGYSLAGLFALWSAYQTDIFSGVAAASPSIWFPGFMDYMKNHILQANSVYLSLGDKEEKTRNPVLAAVGERIREAHDILFRTGVNCTLEWNRGNHFHEPEIRIARAFAWLMNDDRVQNHFP